MPRGASAHFFLANTDYDWYDFLRTRPLLDEVNFWRPSGKGSRLLRQRSKRLWSSRHRIPRLSAQLEIT